jgi:hypothetical protein
MATKITNNILEPTPGPLPKFRNAPKMVPQLEQSEIVFQENFASGHSRKNILTVIGGARNCLRLVVTKDFLWVTSWLPFSIFTTIYDLEHRIPLESVLSVCRTGFLWRNGFLLKYRDEHGGQHSLKLWSWHPEDFMRSLGIRIENDS